MNNYDIHLDLKYKPLELCDAGKLADECGKSWWNQSLVNVNESVIRVGVFHGEFHWHKHDIEDEFFWVIDGKLLLDLDADAEVAVNRTRSVSERPVVSKSKSAKKSTGKPALPSSDETAHMPKETIPARIRTVELGPRQGLMVPHGVLHRTRAKVRTTVLMVEPATVKPTGD